MTPFTKYINSDVSKTAAAMLALLCSALPARSQDSEASAIHELDDLVVIANRFEMPLNRIGSSVELISSLDLQDTNQFFVLEAIRATPGFNVRNNGGPGSVFGMTTRGLNSNRPIILIDGIEASNPASGNIINFGTVFSGSVSKIEALKGPQSSLYGSDAIAGAINIVTQDKTAGPGAFLQIGGGSFDTYQGDFSFSRSANALSYTINFNHYQSNGFSVQDPQLGDAWADDDVYENTTVLAKAEYQANERNLLYFSAYYNESYSEYDPGDPAFLSGSPFADLYTDSETSFAKIGAQSTLNENWTSQFDLAFTDMQSLSKFSAGNPRATIGERFKYDWKNTVGVTDNWNLIAGAEYEIEEESTSGTERDNYSLYAENVVELSEALDWTLGLRYDDNEDYGSETTYRTTFSYSLTDADIRFHGAYGTSFQAPTFFQLSESNGFGNPSLGAETGDGWDIGFEKIFADNHLIFSATAFGYDIDEKIIWDSTATSDSRPWGTYANRERYESQGIESAATWRPNNQVKLKLAHTYADANYGDGVEAERVPRNTYSLLANWNSLEGKLNLNATTLYTSSQYSLRGDAAKMPSYVVVNLAARYKISDSHTLWMRVDNLFDRDYEEVATYQTPSLSAYGGIRFEF